MADAPRSYGVCMPCFDPEIGRRINVTLDGEPVNEVIVYDIDAGHVLTYKRDEAGKPVMVDDEWARELLTGVVVATLTD